MRDAFLPAPRELLETLSEDVELLGTLIEISDSGERAGVFAVVGLGGRQRVIVPVSKLRTLVPLAASCDKLAGKEPS